MREHFDKSLTATIVTYEERLYLLKIENIKDDLIISPSDFDQAIKFIKECRSCCEGDWLAKINNLYSRLEAFLRSYF